MTDYTEREVRKTRELVKERYMSAFGDKVADMLAQLADMLAEREKAKPMVDYDPRSSVTVHTDTTTLQRNHNHPAAQPRVPDVAGLTWEAPDATVNIERVGRFKDGEEHIVRVTFRASDDGRRMTCFYSANEGAARYLHAMLAAQEGRSRE